jgi:hypothetical protein
MECQVSLEVSYTDSTNKKMKHAFNVVDNKNYDAPSVVINSRWHYNYSDGPLLGGGGVEW